jgi:hypothetical protein
MTRALEAAKVLADDSERRGTASATMMTSGERAQMSRELAENYFRRRRAAKVGRTSKRLVAEAVDQRAVLRLEQMSHCPSLGRSRETILS